MAYFTQIFIAALICFSAIEAFKIKECGKNSIFKLVNLKVNPDPPVAGKPVTLKADVDVAETVTGGTVKVTVSKKVWFVTIPLVTKELDLCDISPIGCPIPKGRTSLSITKDIPSFVPAMTYDIEVKATDNRGRELVCMDIQVTIKNRLLELLRRLKQLLRSK